MLDVRPQNLYWEIREAIALREKHTDLNDDQVRAFQGSRHQRGTGPVLEPHENHAADEITNTIPFLANDNPGLAVTSKRPTVQRELVKAMQHGMNRWARDIKLGETLAELALDAMFGFAVCLTTMAPLPGFEDKDAPPLRPACTRIPPKRFFMDPQALHSRNARFMGHEWLRDKDDLAAAMMKDPKTGKMRKVFNAEALEQVAVDDGADMWGGRGIKMPAGVHRVPRNQVRGFEVYVPETKMVYTLSYYITSSGRKEAQFLRDPRPAFAPPWGPYAIFGIYAVPDQVYPLSPMAITAALVDEINAHMDQIAEQADEFRQVTLVNATNDKAIEIIKNAKSSGIYGVPGFDQSQCQTFTVGGPSVEQMDYVDRLRQRLDRRSGMSEFARGNVTGDATATENQLAAKAMDVKRKFMQRAFRIGVMRVVETAGWMMFNSKNVVFDVPMAASDFMDQGAGTQGKPSGEMVDAVFLGGPQAGQEDANFFDLELQIVPFTMELVDDAVIKQQTQQAFALILQAAPLIPQMPYVNWPDLFDDLFEAMGQKDGRKYINWEMLEQMLKAQYAAGQPAQDPANAIEPMQGKGPTQPQGPRPGPGMGGPPQGVQAAGPGRMPDVNALVALLKGKGAAA